MSKRVSLHKAYMSIGKGVDDLARKRDNLANALEELCDVAERSLDAVPFQDIRKARKVLEENRSKDVTDTQA